MEQLALPMRPLDLVNSARPTEEREDEMCALRLGIAKAAKMRIEELKKTAPKDASIRLLMNEGKKQLSELIKFANPYQDEARRLMPDFAGGTEMQLKFPFWRNTSRTPPCRLRNK